MTFAALAKRERDTLEIGRTHAQFAIPITYGFKVAGYIAEMIRHRERIIEAMPRVCAGKMAGAVGTGAALGANFFEVQRRVMSDLGLTYEPAATQVVGRDRYTEAICLMANIAASLERYCTEVRNLQRSEVAEASEYFDVSKQVGSSTMAQKRNPMNSENVCGLARVIRGFVTPAFESQILWHERDLCNSSTERFILPHVFVLIDEILKKTAWIYSGLEIHPQSWKVYKGEREIRMPNREFALLKFLAEHPNIVFSKERLFEAIWGYEYVGDSATVTVHIGRIRDKIEDDPAHPKIIETVWGAGYRLNAPEE